MKTPFVITALTLIATAALADVTVTATARVLKDGKDIGAVPDAIMNGVVTPSEVQTALLKLLADTKQAADKATADAETKAAHALTALRAKKAKEEASGKGKRWEALDELEGELNLTADDIREAELDAQIEKLKAQKRKK